MHSFIGSSSVRSTGARGLSLKLVTDIAGKSASTIQEWCQRDGIGAASGGHVGCVPCFSRRLRNGDAATLASERHTPAMLVEGAKVTAA